MKSTRKKANRQERDAKVAEKVKQDKKRFLKALENSMGMVVHASDATGIHRATHYNWMKEDPEYAEQVQTIMERNIDLSESVLLQAVKNGDLSAVFYYLNNKGKSRGYNVRDWNEEETRKIEIVIKSPLRESDSPKFLPSVTEDEIAADDAVELS